MRSWNSSCSSFERPDIDGGSTIYQRRRVQPGSECPGGEPIKSNGPRTVPLGTQDATLTGADAFPSTTTVCSLLARKAFDQFSSSSSLLLGGSVWQPVAPVQSVT
ncbi:hypothetical protein Bbelb_391580 [Branchiostoma belcheri]|nr:hypothetical protein Bbelb_391580 [Branchiostoma belcheri]